MPKKSIAFILIVILISLVIIVEAGSNDEINMKKNNTIDALKDIKITSLTKKKKYSLEEARKGITIKYQIEIPYDIKGVLSMPQDAGQCSKPDNSGLVIFEKFYGNKQSYSISDTGLCPGVDTENPKFYTLKKGTYTYSFKWNGRNWSGPSDYGAKMGDYFPAGKYKLNISSIGYLDIDIDKNEFLKNKKLKYYLANIGKQIFIIEKEFEIELYKSDIDKLDKDDINDIKITFLTKKIKYSLDEVKKGITIKYQIEIPYDIKGALSMPQNSGGCGEPDKSGLIVFEKLYGNKQSYSISDTGLCPGVDTENPKFYTLKKGTYTYSFKWNGRNWNGPSDYGAKMGDYFPAGKYKLNISAIGYLNIDRDKNYKEENPKLNAFLPDIGKESFNIEKEFSIYLYKAYKE